MHTQDPAQPKAVVASPVSSSRYFANMDELELQDTHPPPDDAEEVEHLALPPTDRGKDAWLTLAACAILEALVWGSAVEFLTTTGFPFSFGVFQAYYSRQKAFKGHLSSIAAIGTTATGLMYCTAPIVYSIIRKYPGYRKAFSIVGYSILLAGLIGASFANTIPQLIVTQGVLYAVGGSLHYFPAFLYLDEWFVKRRGLAYGIFIAGAGVSGVATPFVMEWILSTWGFRTALRTWAVISVVLTTPAFIFMKGRIAAQHVHRGPAKVDLGFVRSPALWILLFGNIIQSLGYFMPTFYMPSFAVAQGWSTLTGTIAISVCSAANVVGATFMGWLVDRYHVTTALNICAIGTVVAVFLFWSFAVYQPMLYIFSFLYGVFAGGFPATWSGCSSAIHCYHPVETGMIISLFTAGKGIGSIISGPVSGALVSSDTWKNRVAYAYGSGYGYLIVFSGVTASFTVVGWLGKRCGMV